MGKIGFVVFPTFGDLGKGSDDAKTLPLCAVKTLSTFHSIRIKGELG